MMIINLSELGVLKRTNVLPSYVTIIFTLHCGVLFATIVYRFTKDSSIPLSRWKRYMIVNWMVGGNSDWTAVAVPALF